MLTQKLLKQGYQYHKLRKTFSKFYRQYHDLISIFQVGLKSLLRQGLSEPDFYGVLVYKLKKIVGSNNFSAQFIKMISHYKRIGYNINVLQQTAWMATLLSSLIARRWVGLQTQIIRFDKATSQRADFNTHNNLLIQKLLKQGYRYHKLLKTFSKFYQRYFVLISKLKVGHKSLLRQGLSEPEFYGDLVYKLKKIVGSNHFSAQFPILKIFAITLMYCNILHAWWSTQSPFATLLSSLIAGGWVWIQTPWFLLKDLSIDEMVGTWCFGYCRPTGVYLLGFFCSGIQFYVLLSPYLCFISYLYLDLYVICWAFV